MTTPIGASCSRSDEVANSCVSAFRITPYNCAVNLNCIAFGGTQIVTSLSWADGMGWSNVNNQSLGNNRKCDGDQVTQTGSDNVSSNNGSHSCRCACEHEVAGAEGEFVGYK